MARRGAGGIAFATLGALTIACAAPAKRRALPPLQPDSSEAAEALSLPLTEPRTVPPLPQTRRVAVRLAFDDRGLHVRVTASGDAPELGRWKMPEDAMTDVSVEDGEGVVKAFERVEGVLEVGAPRTTVAVVYDVKPAAIEDETRRTIIEPARFRALGERILALPVAFDAQRVEATLVIDARAVDVPMSATSFGVGA